MLVAATPAAENVVHRAVAHAVHRASRNAGRTFGSSIANQAAYLNLGSQVRRCGAHACCLAGRGVQMQPKPVHRCGAHACSDAGCTVQLERNSTHTSMFHACATIATVGTAWWCRGVWNSFRHGVRQLSATTANAVLFRRPRMLPTAPSQHRQPQWLGPWTKCGAVVAAQRATTAVGMVQQTRSRAWRMPSSSKHAWQ